jgi:hypothetical protein
MRHDVQIIHINSKACTLYQQTEAIEVTIMNINLIVILPYRVWPVSISHLQIRQDFIDIMTKTPSTANTVSLKVNV